MTRRGAPNETDIEAEIPRAFGRLQTSEASPSGTRIFVSYTLRDGTLGESALRTLDILLSRFGSVYIDLLHNFDPEPQRRVERELDAATVFVFCSTPGVLLSEWVRLEVEAATRRRLPFLRLEYLSERWIAVVDREEGLCQANNEG